MNFVQNCWSCSCYPCVTNAQGCSSFTHRFDAQIAMHSACLLLLVSYCTLTLGLFAPPTRTPGRGLGLLVARTDGSISRLVVELLRASCRRCGYTSARRDVWRQRRTRTSRIEPAVRRLRPQVALPGPNKALTAQPAALRSPRPAGAKRCR